MRVINYPKVGTCPKGQKLIDWGRTGPQGPQGPQGPGVPEGAKGAQGIQGGPGITKIALTTFIASVNIAPGASESVVATCPFGKVASGGFFQVTSDLAISDSFPASPTHWFASAMNNRAVTRNLQVRAVCMTTDPRVVIAKAGKGAKKMGKG